MEERGSGGGGDAGSKRKSSAADRTLRSLRKGAADDLGAVENTGGSSARSDGISSARRGELEPLDGAQLNGADTTFGAESGFDLSICGQGVTPKNPASSSGGSGSGGGGSSSGTTGSKKERRQSKPARTRTSKRTEGSEGGSSRTFNMPPPESQNTLFDGDEEGLMADILDGGF